MTTQHRTLATLRAAGAEGATLLDMAQTLRVGSESVRVAIKELRAKGQPIVAAPSTQDPRYKAYRLVTCPEELDRLGLKPSAEIPSKPRQYVSENARLKRRMVAAQAISTLEIEALPLAAIGRHASAKKPLGMTALSQRLNQPMTMIRPSLTLLVQRGSVIRRNGKPPGYHLPEASAAAAQAASGTSTAQSRTHVNAAMPNGDAGYWRRFMGGQTGAVA